MAAVDKAVWSIVTTECAFGLFDNLEPARSVRENNNRFRTPAMKHCKYLFIVSAVFEVVTVLLRDLR